MRMLAPRSALVLAALTSAALIAACSVEGTTADCTNNVTADGVVQDPEGCQQFAVCDRGPPEACCENFMPGSCDLQRCLFGYGAPRTQEMLDCLDPAGTIGAGGSGGSGGGS